MRSILPITILCLIFILAPLTYGYAQSESEINSKSSMKPATIDGMWTTEDEWSDAAKFSEEGAIFAIKDDSEFLYILMDFVEDKNMESGDLGGINLDLYNDKADKPQPDDFSISLIHSYPEGTKGWIFQGNGTHWIVIWRDDMDIADPLEINYASTNFTDNNPYSKSPHVIYEFAIPRFIFENSSQTGFTAFLEDRKSSGELRLAVNLPKTADYYPASWTTLTFATLSEETSSPTESPTTQTTTEQSPTVTETTPEQPVTPAQPGAGSQERAIIIVIAAIVIITILLFRGSKKQKRK
ncbi:hypothetical protein [[Eubacterium] cellulosolvens]